MPLFLLAAALLARSLCGSAEAGTYQVSQKGRAFQPNQIELHKGDTLRIVNDDDGLLHHAYIKSDAMEFDSGEQNPGDHVDIPFAKSGTFEVRCGIHPKMHLRVDVK